MKARLVTVVAALVVNSAHAQEPTQPLPESRDIQVYNLRDPQATPAAQIAEPPDPPAGNGAWSLNVHTTGGFTGQGIGSVTISSNGRVACSSTAPCATPVTAASLNAVGIALGSLGDAAWIRRTTSSFCRDCIQTTITLKRREGDAIRTFITTWDDSQSPGPELRELRRLAFELRAAQR